MKILKAIISSFKYRWALTRQDRFIKYLRRTGIVIGDNCQIPSPRHVVIDRSRPSLVEIGNNVRINSGFELQTHDYATIVFLNKYNEFVNSSGKIVIGNNVYFGHNCTVLKGVSIGDNCIIGYGSMVIKNIPANSVAAGSPAKVICTIDEYFEKRKHKSVEEAFEYARSIVERYNRKPEISDFWEEFPLFVDNSNIDKYSSLPIKQQLGKSYDIWINDHKAVFSSFDEFLNEALNEK